jgi:hypothetical protein
MINLYLTYIINNMIKLKLIYQKNKTIKKYIIALSQKKLIANKPLGKFIKLFSPQNRFD